ncbi:hypothetical protein HGRIS_005762 [Hohenbuehelia grisea]|uniref:F-box domain-containing protein n=1 Tax=Hohenbuehelia grisea TaxID=104357 RepID=A0ABR3JXT5_9AGAR
MLWSIWDLQDLQAALAIEPDNHHARGLLHNPVKHHLSPSPFAASFASSSSASSHLHSTSPAPSIDPPLRGTPVSSGPRFSPEIWREIVLFLPRRDLKTLLRVPHTLSRIASQLLFCKINLYFSSWESVEEDETETWRSSAVGPGHAGMGLIDAHKGGAGGSTSVHADHAEQDSWHAQRSADILTRIIVDPGFAALVKTLRIYATKRDRDGSLAFQIGMLTNALPKIVNLRNVHIASHSEGLFPILRVVQSTSPNLRGLSISSPDGPGELGLLEFKQLAQFSYKTSRTNNNIAHVSSFLSQNRTTLRIVSLDTPAAVFPTDVLALRNLTHVDFNGHFPLNSQVLLAILSDGRQLESLAIGCFLDCQGLSAQFRDLPNALPFLRHFAFSVHRLNRRITDADLFPAIADFLRDRRQLRTLHLTVPDDYVQRAIGFDASVWGVLPSLVDLKSLAITYPIDLSPGLASWLIPRSVLALNIDCVNLPMRDPVPFLNQLRTGIPPSLRYIGMTECPLRTISAIVEQGFPMVRLIRVGSNYWTVARSADDTVVELEQWPKRRVMYHASEWLEWLGCEDARWRDHSEFPP